MNDLRTSRKFHVAFRGIVLTLALILVACGSDSEEPTPTATTSTGADAVPTLPSTVGTPESSINEGNISVTTPESIATAEAPPSTPEESEDGETIDVASTPEAGPADLTGSPETQSEATSEIADTEAVATEPAASTPAVEETATEVPATAEGTPPASDGQPSQPVANASSSPVATERPLTGNETYTNPGDGTGGSGMPGERSSTDEEAPLASPAASPVAQFSVIGCEVPDVPNYVGETTTFTLTVDLNFRVGPGVACDPVMDTPLGEGQQVVVVGGPVIQSEDNSEWVQIDVDGTTGWITTEFIVPVE